MVGLLLLQACVPLFGATLFLGRARPRVALPNAQMQLAYQAARLAVEQETRSRPWIQKQPMRFHSATYMYPAPYPEHSHRKNGSAKRRFSNRGREVRCIAFRRGFRAWLLSVALDKSLKLLTFSACHWAMDSKTFERRLVLDGAVTCALLRALLRSPGRPWRRRSRSKRKTRDRERSSGMRVKSLAATVRSSRRHYHEHFEGAGYSS